MYTKVVRTNLFFPSESYTQFLKNGVVVAVRYKGELKLSPKYPEPIRLTRAQGYKYWTRHFIDRPYWRLPKALEEAIFEEPRYFGTYIDRNGELVGTEG